MSDPAGGYNNPATSEDHQRSYQHILNDLKQNWNPLGWQHEIVHTERAGAIFQIAAALREVRSDVDQSHAVQISTVFERNAYDKSTGANDYRMVCRSKLQQIRESRKRQEAEQEWRNSQVNPEQQQGMQQGYSLQPQYSNVVQSPLPPQFTQLSQQQQEQFQQQQRYQQQMQLQQQYNQQQQQQQQLQQLQQQQQQQHQQQQPARTQYQQPIFQLSQQQQQERNQIILELMNSVAQEVGSARLLSLNQDPPPELRELAAAWSMQPAQAFLRQQAMVLYRERVLYQQQQMQMQEMQAQGMQGENGQNGYPNNQ